MSAVTGLRNILAAAAAIAAWWFAARGAAPHLAPHVSDPAGLCALLGLSTLLTPVLHAVLVGVLTRVRLGGRSPTRSAVVSVIGGAAILALVASAAAFVVAQALAQAPAGEAWARWATDHSSALELTAAAIAALCVGAWIGRRHGRGLALLSVVGSTALGWSATLAVASLAGGRSLAELCAPLQTLRDGLSTGALAACQAAAHTVELPLLLVTLAAAGVGALLAGGRRRGAGQPQRSLLLAG